MTTSRRTAHPVIALAVLAMLLLAAAPTHAAPAPAVGAQPLLVDGVLVDGTYDIVAELTVLTGPDDLDGPETVRGVLEVETVRVGRWEDGREFGTLQGTLTLDDGTVITYLPNGNNLAFEGKNSDRFPPFGILFQGGGPGTPGFNFSNGAYPQTGVRIEDGELAAFRAQVGRRTVGPNGERIWEIGELNATRR